jgi:cytochrome c553
MAKPRLLICFFLPALVGLAGARLTWAAGQAKDRAPGAAVPTFEGQVRAILQARCWRCHGEKKQKAELALHTPEAIRKGSESGPVIQPGKASESLLFDMIRKGKMPPPREKNPLSPGEVEIIRRWIDGGASFGSSASARAEVTRHDVLPILYLRCTVCHGKQMREGGLDLRTRAAMLKGGKSGPAFVPGNAEASLILKRIQSGEMPPRKRLIEAAVKPIEAAEIKKLARWIALGAPEVADEPDAAGTDADPLVTSRDRDFWAFRPPANVSVPNVTRGDLVRNPIDAFVLHKLEAGGLTLAPEAGRLVLLRRATLDLTGMLPEPAEVKAFLADHRPDAYERLIDRLLASPRYGERWGRHWLDLAGYADCEGRREQHLPRPFAWRYRDYVIRSFNTDKPYDRFLSEQLAGDDLADYEHATEITQAMEDNLVATAFLRMAPDPTWANLTGFVPDRLEVIADAMDVLGSGIMGLTLKCARCHSHKFDPIPQRDYYRLVDLFKGAYDEHNWLKPERKGFGGAVSMGGGERYLPCVTTAERRRWEARKSGPEPRIMALWDRGDPSPTYIYRRGDFFSPGQPVTAGPPAVLCDTKVPFRYSPPRPGAKSTGRRLAFARWLTQPDHPLTARVMVNRIWKHHFGRGIVPSLGNFGKAGQRPTHPELLDWLAREFIRRGWSMKAMHRLMMTSHVYRQSSSVTPLQQQLDPDNRLLSCMPLRRMEAEELRDSLLQISGRLDETRFGPPDPVKVLPDGLVQAGRRRSIYVQMLRKHPPSLLESFDLPSMNPNCLQRSESLVATQALHLLNDALVRKLAADFADRVLREAGDHPARQIEQVFLVALNRTPTRAEIEISREALARFRREWSKQSEPAATPNAVAQRSLTSFCHAMMNSAMFVYID